MMLISGIKKEHAVWNKKTQLELNSNSVTYDPCDFGSDT